MYHKTQVKEGNQVPCVGPRVIEEHLLGTDMTPVHSFIFHLPAMTLVEPFSPAGF